MKLTRVPYVVIPNPEGFIKINDVILIEGTPGEVYDGEYAKVIASNTGDETLIKALMN